MSHLSTPKPDEPNPPGVKPNQPEDPSVYGGQWGRAGEKQPPSEAPPQDRPDEIKPPAAPQGDATPSTPDAQSSF